MGAIEVIGDLDIYGPCLETNRSYPIRQWRQQHTFELLISSTNESFSPECSIPDISLYDGGDVRVAVETHSAPPTPCKIDALHSPFMPLCKRKFNPVTRSP